MQSTILIFGGSSEERLVSVASAQNLAKNFRFDLLWFLSPMGRIISVDIDDLIQHQNPFKVPFNPIERQRSRSLAEAIATLKDESIFLGLHGTEGEDGQIQAMLEQSKIAFTGSGSDSSRLCFDKAAAKKAVSGSGIQVSNELILTSEGQNSFETKLREFFSQNRKIVIKPVANGSSVGLHIVADGASLEAAIANIKKSNYGIFMAEKFVTGRELTIGVIDDGRQLSALPPSEVLLSAGHSFDYDGKYLGKGTTEITPANISASEREQAQSLALKAHQTLGCYGYSRTDAILHADGITFLETNSLPGLTKASFLPQQLQCEHIDMLQFIQQQLRLAKQRYNSNSGI